MNRTTKISKAKFFGLDIISPSLQVTEASLIEYSVITLLYLFGSPIHSLQFVRPGAFERPSKIANSLKH